MKYLKITTAIVAALGVSACSGGGSKLADAPVIDVPDVPATYANKAAYVAEIEATIDKGDLAHLPYDYMPPTEGTAEYAGVMVLPDPHRSGSLMGNSSSEIDFSTGTSTGVAGNFTNDIGESWAGTLTSSGDSVSASVITGTLTNDVSGDTEIDGKVELVDMDSYASWDSVEDGVAIPEYTYGHITGTATTDGVETELGEDNAYYYGELVD